MIPTSLSRFWSCLTLIFFGTGLWPPCGVHGQTTTELDTSVQTETGFMGWYLGLSTSTNALFDTIFTLWIDSTDISFTAKAVMDTQTWATLGSYAGVCDGTSCLYATNCDNSIITYDDGATGSW